MLSKHKPKPTQNIKFLKNSAQFGLLTIPRVVNRVGNVVILSEKAWVKILR